MCRKIKLGYLITPHTRINSKWSKGLNVRTEAIKILENIGSKISDIAHRNFLSNISPWTKETKEKINKWDFIKLKRFCTAKENHQQNKKTATEWENIFADTLIRG